MKRDAIKPVEDMKKEIQELFHWISSNQVPSKKDGNNELSSEERAHFYRNFQK